MSYKSSFKGCHRDIHLGIGWTASLSRGHWAGKLQKQVTHGIAASNLRYYAQDFGGGTALLEFVQSTLEAAEKLPSLQFERDGWVKSFQVKIKWSWPKVTLFQCWNDVRMILSWCVYTVYYIIYRIRAWFQSGIHFADMGWWLAIDQISSWKLWHT